MLLEEDPALGDSGPRRMEELGVLQSADTPLAWLLCSGQGRQALRQKYQEAQQPCRPHNLPVLQVAQQRELKVLQAQAGWPARLYCGYHLALLTGLS
ncbi:hypothetical protein P7K49_016894 [Saguinus oedipus]|uniref:Uncharacterized protein n=1 Tax=Saguinus oedipus TaxID=9490 RepID=A0ABQ9VE03_SAGOE|nr:hypothetical protein P7K49_016894 [Saguinus oedipus]